MPGLAVSPEAVSYNIYRSMALGSPYNLTGEGHITDYATYLGEGLANGMTYQTMAEDHAGQRVGECHPYREFEGMQPSTSMKLP